MTTIAVSSQLRKEGAAVWEAALHAPVVITDEENEFVVLSKSEFDRISHLDTKAAPGPETLQPGDKGFVSAADALAMHDEDIDIDVEEGRHLSVADTLSMPAEFWGDEDIDNA